MRDFEQSNSSNSGSSVFVDDSSAAGGFRGAITGLRKRPRPPKLYRIGEIVDYSGLSRQTIHNYTTMGLLRESKWTRGGHRLYDESVFERLEQVLVLKHEQKSMDQIREHFRRIDQA